MSRVRVVAAACGIDSGRSQGLERLGYHARGNLPGEAPAVLAPTALAFRPPIVDDRVPVAVRLFLIVRRDLEREGLAVPERRAAVETETGNAQNGELHRQHIALLAARVVAGRLVNGGHFTIRKGGGVEARRVDRVLVEPETNRILWLHARGICKFWTADGSSSGDGRPLYCAPCL